MSVALAAMTFLAIAIGAILLGILVGMPLDKFFKSDDNIISYVAACLFLCIAMIFMKPLMTHFEQRRCSKAVAEQYQAALQSEAAMAFASEHADEFDVFKELFIDKLESFDAKKKNELFKCMILRAMKNRAAKAPMTEEEKDSVKVAMIFVRAAYQDHKDYKKFLEMASKFTDFSFEDNKMVLSYREFQKNPSCICGKCGREVVKTFSLEVW